MDYQVLEGIRCYAPELAYQNPHFPADKFDRLLEVEEENFWYRSRTRIIRFLVQRHLGDREVSFLEIGCGTGSVLKSLEGLRSLRLVGAEVHLSALRLARARLPAVEFIQLDATSLPFDSEFHAIGMFDILEHIEQDDAAIKNAYRALRAGGTLFITAPQHQFLWSANDEAAFHKRRYSLEDLSLKLEGAGFRVVFSSSFVFLLFPLMCLRRLLRRRTSPLDPYEAVMKELELPAFANRALGAFMRVDEWLIRCGVSLPFGGSLVVVARKALVGGPA